MLVGIAGCGKTQLLKGLLGRQDEEKRISCTINMNYFTTTNLLQSSMETVLVKKTGTSFGPPGKADLIYFIDDLNLPEVDQYDTQSAISLLRMVSRKTKLFSAFPSFYKQCCPMYATCKLHNLNFIHCLNCL